MTAVDIPERDDHDLRNPERRGFVRLYGVIVLGLLAFVSIRLLPDARPAGVVLSMPGSAWLVGAAMAATFILAIVARKNASIPDVVVVVLFVAIWGAAAVIKHNSATYLTADGISVAALMPWEEREQIRWGEKTALQIGCSERVTRRGAQQSVVFDVALPDKRRFIFAQQATGIGLPWLQAALTAERAAAAKGVRAVEAAQGVQEGCVQAQREQLSPEAFAAFTRLMARINPPSPA
jgi:hypothetical protein